MTMDLPSDEVKEAILEDSHNKLMIGTTVDLVRWMPLDSNGVLFVMMGLPGNYIYGVNEDDRGQIWLERRLACQI